jgi:hypothetical protein
MEGVLTDIEQVQKAPAQEQRLPDKLDIPQLTPSSFQVKDNQEQPVRQNESMREWSHAELQHDLLEMVRN